MARRKKNYSFEDKFKVTEWIRNNVEWILIERPSKPALAKKLREEGVADVSDNVVSEVCGLLNIK
jgi:hypothetical protein